MGLGLRDAGLQAKPVILVASPASLSLSSLICKVGTLTPTPAEGSFGGGGSGEIKGESGLCERPFTAQTKVPLAGYLCP